MVPVGEVTVIWLALSVPLWQVWHVLSPGAPVFPRGGLLLEAQTINGMTRTIAAISHAWLFLSFEMFITLSSLRGFVSAPCRQKTALGHWQSQNSTTAEEKFECEGAVLLPVALGRVFGYRGAFASPSKLGECLGTNRS